MPSNHNLNKDSSDYGFKNMPQPQKTAVIALSVLGVGIIFFGALQFRERVVGPFNPKNGKLPSTVASFDLMNIDTDKDGLSDYDEANVYHTSRYLPDTDSDGISDGEEVNNGTDPNCAIGKICSGEIDFSASVGVDNLSTTSSSTVAGTDGLGAITISSQTSETDLQNTLAGQVDAPTLRKILLESGADKETLDKISDEDLLKSYQEVLNK